MKRPVEPPHTPGHIRDVRRYKAGSEDIILWLASGTSSFRERIAKAREDAGHYQVGSSFFTRSELLLAAENICARNNPRITPAILDTIELVIHLRTRCATWYIVNRPHETEANIRHQNFITLLQKIEDLLKARVAEQEKKQQGNMFETLSTADDDDIQETELLFGSCGPVAEASPKFPMPRLRIEDDPLEDVALWEFMHVQAEWAAFVAKTWTMSVAADSSVEWASAATLDAIRAMKLSYENFNGRHPGLATAEQLHTWLQVDIVQTERAYKNRNRKRRFRTDKRPFSVAKQHLPTRHDLVFAQGYALVKKAIDRARHAQQQDNILCNPAPTKANEPIFGCAWSALLDFIVQGGAIKGSGDCFIEALQDIVNSATGSIPTWIPSACIAYQTAFLHLGEPTPKVWNLAKIRSLRGLTACQAVGRVMFNEDSPATLGERATVESLQKCLHSCQSIVDDNISDRPTRFNKCVVSLPGLASSYNYQVILQTYDLGMRVCNTGFLLAGVAHIYLAALNYGLINQLWPDMEYILTAHEDDFTYLPAYTPGPAAAEKTYSNFCAALGVKHKNGKTSIKTTPTRVTIKSKLPPDHLQQSSDDPWESKDVGARVGESNEETPETLGDRKAQLDRNGVEFTFSYVDIAAWCADFLSKLRRRCRLKTDTSFVQIVDAVLRDASQIYDQDRRSLGRESMLAKHAQSMLVEVTEQEQHITKARVFIEMSKISKCISGADK